MLKLLRQKVYQQSTLLPLANSLVDQHQGQVVSWLADAIRNRRQVRLLRYHSINSNSIRDRLIEPYSFSENFTQITAFEPDSDTVKTFKTQRIEDVAILEAAQTKPPTEVLTDPFDWPGEQKKVSLRLTYQAYHLLREEYPLTRPDILLTTDDTDFPYTYEGIVRSWVGIGRFVLGIPGQVRVNEPEEFRAYLRGRVGEFTW